MREKDLQQFSLCFKKGIFLPANAQEHKKNKGKASHRMKPSRRSFEQNVVKIQLKGNQCALAADLCCQTAKDVLSESSTCFY